MANDSAKSTNVGKATIAQPESDSAPKTYTLGQQILSGLKMAAIVGIIFVLLWLFDKLQFY